LSWIEEGGNLVLSLDFPPFEIDIDASDFLNRLGLVMLDSSEERSYRYQDEEPRLDRAVSFGFSEENVDALVMKDSDGFRRLVPVTKGKGKVTITGNCRFMSTFYLREPSNSRLAWNLLAESRGVPGVFFIRGRRREIEKSFFGDLFERGNLTALIVSALVLIAVGFWAVLPVFGLVKSDDAKPGKPLRARFLAEGRFLKRYGALESYLAAYQDEIRRKLIKKENLNNEDEIIIRAAAVWREASSGLLVERPEEAVRQAFSRQPVRYGEFRKSVRILKTILECL
jgi:hypothetical protein